MFTRLCLLTKEITLKGLNLQKTKNKTGIVEKIDSFSKCAIRQKVHKFFLRNEQPTLEKVLSSVNDDINLPNFKRTTFYGVLKKLDFFSLQFERKKYILFS